MNRGILSIAASSLILMASAAYADAALDQQLCDASKSGASAQIRALLRQGANADATCLSKSGDDQFGPLYLAVGADSVDGAAALLDAGAKVDRLETKYGLQAIFKIKSPAAGQLLLSHGATLNARNKRGETPFQYVGDRIGSTFSEEQAVAVGAFMLAHGADVNEAVNDTMTPLMQSVVMQDKTYLTFLLDHGADFRWRNKKGDTALTVAINLQGSLKPEFAGGYKAIEALLRARGATP